MGNQTSVENTIANAIGSCPITGSQCSPNYSTNTMTCNYTFTDITGRSYTTPFTYPICNNPAGTAQSTANGFMTVPATSTTSTTNFTMPQNTSSGMTNTDTIPYIPITGGSAPITSNSSISHFTSTGRYPYQRAPVNTNTRTVIIVLLIIILIGIFYFGSKCNKFNY